MVHFGKFLKTWSLRSNSVTRQVSFNRTKIGGKCQNSKIQIRHFGWFSNTVNLVYQKEADFWTYGIHRHNLFVLHRILIAFSRHFVFRDKSRVKLCVLNFLIEILWRAEVGSNVQKLSVNLSVEIGPHTLLGKIPAQPRPKPGLSLQKCTEWSVT